MASAEICNAAWAHGGTEVMGSRGVLAVGVGWEGADVPRGAGKCGGSLGRALMMFCCLPNPLTSSKQRALKKVKEKQPSIQKC